MYPTPYGLRPSGTLSGSGSFSSKVRAYPLSTAGAPTAPIVFGNPVALTSGGVVECGLGATTAGNAALQAPATSFVGVFVGVKKATNDGLPLEDQIVSTTPAAGDQALIVDDPDATFTAITTPMTSVSAAAALANTLDDSLTLSPTVTVLAPNGTSTMSSSFTRYDAGLTTMCNISVTSPTLCRGTTPQPLFCEIHQPSLCPL